jgi:hypothetical protein
MPVPAPFLSLFPLAVLWLFIMYERARREP